MIRVAVISAPGPGLVDIREALSASTFKVRCFPSLPDVESGLRMFAPQVIIVRFPTFEDTRIELAKRIRDAFKDASVIACAEKIEDLYRFRLLKEPRLALASLAHELTDLADLARRVSCGGAGPRAHARARRHEKIEVLGRGGSAVLGRFIDFGKMGAKLQVPNGKLKPNDRILLHYVSNYSEMVRKIQAVVIWKEASSGLGASLLGTHIVGVKFIAYI